MSVTELAYGLFGSLPASNSFVTGNHALRSAWQNSFFMPTYPDDGYVLYCGAGGVSVSGSTNTYGPPGANAGVAILAGGQYAGTSTGVLQTYIDLSGLVHCASAASTSASFPGGSIPLCYMVVDKVGRTQQVIDARTSYLSSAPNLGSGMTESIAAPTLRAGFVANFYVPRTYALTPQLPFDIALPASEFTLGGGAVVISSSTITTPTTVWSLATNGAANGWKQLNASAVTQIYIDPSSGQIASRIPATPGTFPSNSLAIAEVTCDSSFIRTISDLRPSYI